MLFMISQNIDLVAGDFNGAAWRCRSRATNSIGFSQIAFPITVLPKRMTVQIPFKRNDWVFDTGHDLGHLCHGRRIQMSGHSDFGVFNNL